MGRMSAVIAKEAVAIVSQHGLSAQLSMDPVGVAVQVGTRVSILRMVRDGENPSEVAEEAVRLAKAVEKELWRG